MTLLVDILSWILLTSGAFFFLVGAAGLVRMPDVFTRMHAASVTDTLGSGLIIGGLMLQAGWTLVSAKLAIIGILFFLTGPVVSHALAQAALHLGVRPKLENDGELEEIMPIAFDNEDARKRAGRLP